MPEYCVNSRPQTTGEREVHDKSKFCLHRPNDCIDLGYHQNCWGAVQAARRGGRPRTGPARSATSASRTPFSQRTDGAGDVAPEEAHVGGLAVGVGLAAADGDQQAAFLPRVGHVPPLERCGFRAP